MSYTTSTIVIKTDSETEQLALELEELFKYYKVRPVFSPFKGVVCQLNEAYKQYPYENFKEDFFKSQEHATEYFSQTDGV
ncbi:hypothetical protein ACLI09_12360 [Flavobacterium sp. RHBU_24]|uniref:hypothetical protein n=1 Tax=Flavobacterium sp. RHBU_24 TaxID=3391185 RepID=UPI003984DBB1